MNETEINNLFEIFKKQKSEIDFGAAEKTIDTLIQELAISDNQSQLSFLQNYTEYKCKSSLLSKKRNFAKSMLRGRSLHNSQDAIFIKEKGIIYEDTNRHNEAIACHKKAFSIAAQNNLSVLPHIAIHLSVLYDNLGLRDAAEQVLLETIQVKRILVPSLVAVYTRILRLPKNDVQEIKKIMETFDNYEITERCDLLTKIVELLMAQNEFALAIVLLTDLLNIASDPKARISYSQNIGICYCKIRENQKAIGHFMCAATLAMEEKDPYAIAFVNLNLGLCYADCGQLPEANARLADAHALAMENNFSDILQQIERIQNHSRQS